MPDKKGLQQLQATAVAAGGVFGTAVRANMRRYIYSIKTANQFAGANQLEIGHSADAGLTHTTLDWVPHATQWERWVDPDELKEDALPIYIIPAGNQLYLDTDNGNIECFFEYEDAV